MVRRPIAWLTAALLLAGCGSSSSSSSSPPKPNESISAFGQRVKTLATSTSCTDVVQFQKLFVNNSAFPPCARAQQFLRQLSISAAASYGTGGTLDFTDAGNPKGGTYIAAVSKGGKWVIVFDPATGQPSVGTTPPSTAPYEQSLTATLTAIRKHDCKAFFTHVLTGQGATQAAFCAQAFKSPVVKLVQSNPGAKPTALGGNRLVQFWGLALGKHYYTFPVLGPPPNSHDQYLVVPPEPAS